MSSIQKQVHISAITRAAINRPSFAFALIVALAIVLVACGLGRLTFQSGAPGWSPDAAAEATSLLGQ
jgi:hypothetical protein